MKKNSAINFILILCAAIFLFGLGYRLGQLKALQTTGATYPYKTINTTPQGSFSQVKTLDFSSFWDVWDNLQEKFVDRSKLDPQNMFYAALKGLAGSVGDSYTFFLTPTENKQSKEDLGGKFEGIGAQLGLKNNQIVVIAPLKNSPAEKAGVKAGDFITKVDGQTSKGWTLPQAVAKIRGNKGTTVKLTLSRDGKEFDANITREEIDVASVELSYEKRQDCTSSCQQAAYLKVNQFGENTNDEWNKAVTAVVSKWNNRSIKGVVVDLRDNPGGFLDSSVYLASEFLPQGKLVVKQESTISENNRDYYVTRQGHLLDIPVVGIINKGSASASEIFAGALQDYKRAKLVGEKSFGKGSVQEAVDLKDGSGLHITIAKWLLPNGVWINDKGVDPDIKVENKIPEGNTLTRQNDSQLEKAVEEIIK